MNCYGNWLIKPLRDEPVARRHYIFRTVSATGAQTCLNSLYYYSLLPVKVPKMAFHRHLFKSVLSEGLIKDNCH